MPLMVSPSAVSPCNVYQKGSFPVVLEMLWAADSSPIVTSDGSPVDLGAMFLLASDGSGILLKA